MMINVIEIFNFQQMMIESQDHLPTMNHIWCNRNIPFQSNDFKCIKNILLSINDGKVHRMMFFHWIIFLAIVMYHFDQMMMNGTKTSCFEYMMINGKVRFTFNESHGYYRNIPLLSNNDKYSRNILLSTYDDRVYRITYHNQ